jgi:hypothetical protein
VNSALDEFAHQLIGLGWHDKERRGPRYRQSDCESTLPRHGLAAQNRRAQCHSGHHHGGESEADDFEPIRQILVLQHSASRGLDQRFDEYYGLDRRPQCQTAMYAPQPAHRLEIGAEAIDQYPMMLVMDYFTRCRQFLRR